MGDLLRLRGGDTQQAEQVLDGVVQVDVVEGTLEAAAERPDHRTAQD